MRKGKRNKKASRKQSKANKQPNNPGPALEETNPYLIMVDNFEKRSNVGSESGKSAPYPILENTSFNVLSQSSGGSLRVSESPQPTVSQDDEDNSSSKGKEEWKKKNPLPDDACCDCITTNNNPD